MIDKAKQNPAAADAKQRELVVAYLSYALDDVRALSPVGLRLLEMTIASLTESAAASDSDLPSQPAS